MMKNVSLFITIVAMVISCNKSPVEKPENLIPRDKMVDVIYDLSVLDALKSQRPIYLEQNNINPRTFVFEKYKIDSLQFAKSDQYYASDLTEYKKMYDEVSHRLEERKKEADKALEKQGLQPPSDPEAPMVR